MEVGVLAVQGAVSEHEDALHRAADALGMPVNVRAVRSASDMDGLQGIILPGGESTTISRLLRSTGIQPILMERGGKDLAVFGTCAGMILLASRADHDVAEKDIQLLGLLDATVDRNAFGRQRESFEGPVTFDGEEMHAVFIRAPCFADCNDVVLAVHGERIVAASRGSVMGVAFHPELTPDTRIHERFLQSCS
ncbi:MAG: pyridoxal 5'-phosphate synthase glutaminase subunit PdxT [Thermoplasmatota archaeon]